MGKLKINALDRRQFCSRAPAAVAFCIGCSQGWAMAAANSQTQTEQVLHAFEQEMPPLTVLQLIRFRYSSQIGILDRLAEEIGREPFLELLKNASFAENVELGKRLSDRIDSLATFAGPFKDPNSLVGKTIVREIITDTDTVFEMKITECATEKVFREAGAPDLGYACVCHADFGLPKGLEIDIELERSKTLMQGDECCNHRYVLKG